ncbi:hypothetical protein L6R52_02980 [Myxococcota bacterium]|nr:hypothetical protein [Myxococcota bacterium]
MWEVILGYGIVLLAGASAFGAYRTRKRLLEANALTTFRIAAHRAGASPARSGRPDEAELDRFTLHVETRATGTSGDREHAVDTATTRLTLRSNGLVDRRIVLEPEGALATLGKVIKGRDLEIGDDELDARILVRGDELVLRGLLDEETRRLVVSTVAVLGVHVRDGELTIEADDLHRDPTRLVYLIQRMGELAQALRGDIRDPVERLLDTVLQDRLTKVRTRALALLTERAPTHPRLSEIASALLEARDPALRLAAAVSLKSGGGDTIASIARDPTLPTSVRSEAARQLVRRHPEPDTLLLELLASDLSELRCIAMEGLRRRRVAAAVDPLVVVLTQGPPEDALLAVEALRFIGDRRATPALVAELDDPRATNDVKVACVRALGSLGDRDVVEALRPLSSGLFTDRALKEAARLAIERIQKREVKRLGDGIAGRLAVVDAVDPGALSLSDESAGALSMSEDARGALSRSERDARGALSTSGEDARGRDDE